MEDMEQGFEADLFLPLEVPLLYVLLVFLQKSLALCLELGHLDINVNVSINIIVYLCTGFIP